MCVNRVQADGGARWANHRIVIELSRIDIECSFDEMSRKRTRAARRMDN
jgi:hypothetical protein